MGLLILRGTLDTTQFWPTGESDADTVKVDVTGQATPWKFDDKITHAFDGAFVRGKVRKSVLDKHNRVTIRLQGIDAPELHYPPRNYRQPTGESAAAALGAFAAAIGPKIVPCRVTTQVAEPNDVFDTYGRMVGDVWLTVGGKDTDVNLWLAREGWAFPTFYTSMTDAEIKQVMQLTEAARQAKKNIWKHYTSKIGPLDTSLVFRPKGPPGPDPGTVCMPKLFRRLCAWQDAKTKGTTTATTLKAFLGKLKPPDLFMQTADFLQNSIHSAQQLHLAAEIGAGDVLQLSPKDMVFSEKPSTLVNAVGTLITGWS